MSSDGDFRLLNLGFFNLFNLLYLLYLFNLFSLVFSLVSGLVENGLVCKLVLVFMIVFGLAFVIMFSLEFMIVFGLVSSLAFVMVFGLVSSLAFMMVFLLVNDFNDILVLFSCVVSAHLVTEFGVGLPFTSVVVCLLLSIMVTTRVDISMDLLHHLFPEGGVVHLLHQTFGLLGINTMSCELLHHLFSCFRGLHLLVEGFSVFLPVSIVSVFLDMSECLLEVFVVLQVCELGTDFFVVLHVSELVADVFVVLESFKHFHDLLVVLVHVLSLVSELVFVMGRHERHSVEGLFLLEWHHCWSERHSVEGLFLLEWHHCWRESHGLRTEVGDVLAAQMVGGGEAAMVSQVLLDISVGKASHEVVALLSTEAKATVLPIGIGPCEYS